MAPPAQTGGRCAGVRVVYRHLVVIPLVQADCLAAEKVNGRQEYHITIPLTEGFQDRQPNRAALLRVKLTAHDIAPGHRGGELGSVFRRGDDHVVTFSRIKGVDKIHTVPSSTPASRGCRRPAENEGRSSRCGEFYTPGEQPLHRHHLAGEQAKPLPSAKLPALLKQKLHAQADAQNGLALGRFLPDHPVQTGRRSFSAASAKRPTPGERVYRPGGAPPGPR